MPNQIQILYVAAFIMDMAVAGTTFTLLRRAGDSQADAVTLGLLGALWLAVYTGVALWSGRWSDRVGRRRVVAIGCVVSGAASFLCGLTESNWLLLVLTAGFGLGVGCFWPSMIAWLGDDAKDGHLMARLTKFNLAWNVGLLAGFGLSGWLYTLWPNGPFYIAGVMKLLLPILLLAPARPARDAASSFPKVKPVHVPKGRGFRQTAWVANFALMFGMGGLNALFPQVAAALDIEADSHGILLALSRGAAMTVFAMLQWLQFWRTRLWPLWVAQLMAAGGLCVVGTGEAFWLFAAGFIVVGAVSGYTYQASIMFTLEEISEKGKGSGFHEATLASGMCLGPLLAGWIGQQTAQLRAPYFFCGAVVVVLVMTQIVTVLMRRQQT
jgi:MFS family permease